MMTVDDALAEVDNRIAGRTMYEGRKASIDEVLAAEVRRLRIERDELMAALDRHVPALAVVLDRKFKDERTQAHD